MGSKKFFEILKCAREGDRLILVGDVKQLQSIEAGGIFGKLQEIEAIKTVRMSENIRQRRKHVLETAMELAEKRFANAFARLESKERFIEIVNREERIQTVANAFLQSHDKENTLVVVRSNEERIQINDAIREGLKQNRRLNPDSYRIPVWQARNLSSIEKTMAAAYGEGDHFYVVKSGGGLPAGAVGTVMSIKHKENSLEAQVLFRDQVARKKIDLSEHGLNLNVFRASEREFSSGDRIVFHKNDRLLGI